MTREGYFREDLAALLREGLSVCAAIESTPDDTAVEVVLFRDPADGVWVAYPVGGAWPSTIDTEHLPIVAGPDPVGVVRELLARPSGLNACSDCCRPTPTGICPECLERRR